MTAGGLTRLSAAAQRGVLLMVEGLTRHAEGQLALARVSAVLISIL